MGRPTGAGQAVAPAGAGSPRRQHRSSVVRSRRRFEVANKYGAFLRSCRHIHLLQDCEQQPQQRQQPKQPQPAERAAQSPGRRLVLRKRLAPAQVDGPRLARPAAVAAAAAAKPISAFRSSLPAPTPLTCASFLLLVNCAILFLTLNPMLRPQQQQQQVAAAAVESQQSDQPQWQPQQQQQHHFRHPHLHPHQRSHLRPHENEKVNENENGKIEHKTKNENNSLEPETSGTSRQRHRPRPRHPLEGRHLLDDNEVVRTKRPPKRHRAHFAERHQTGLATEPDGAAPALSWRHLEAAVTHKVAGKPRHPGERQATSEWQSRNPQVRFWAVRKSSAGASGRTSGFLARQHGPAREADRLFEHQRAFLDAEDDDEDAATLSLLDSEVELVHDHNHDHDHGGGDDDDDGADDDDAADDDDDDDDGDDDDDDGMDEPEDGSDELNQIAGEATGGELQVAGNMIEPASPHVLHRLHERRQRKLNERPASHGAGRRKSPPPPPPPPPPSLLPPPLLPGDQHKQQQQRHLGTGKPLKPNALRQQGARVPYQKPVVVSISDNSFVSASPALVAATTQQPPPPPQPLPQSLPSRTEVVELREDVGTSTSTSSTTATTTGADRAISAVPSLPGVAVAGGPDSELDNEVERINDAFDDDHDDDDDDDGEISSRRAPAEPKNATIGSLAPVVPGHFDRYTYVVGDSDPRPEVRAPLARPLKSDVTGPRKEAGLVSVIVDDDADAEGDDGPHADLATAEQLDELDELDDEDALDSLATDSPAASDDSRPLESMQLRHRPAESHDTVASASAPAKYSNLIVSPQNELPSSGGRRRFWHSQAQPHLASIRMVQEDPNEYQQQAGNLNSALIAILFGVGATGVLVMIVGAKMRSIRERLAHKGRRRSLVPDTDFLINTIPI